MGFAKEGETIEGSITMRNRPYPVLKCSKVRPERVLAVEVLLEERERETTSVLLRLAVGAGKELSVGEEGGVT